MAGGQTTLGIAAAWGYGVVQPEETTITSPAADAGFTYTVGTNYYERPISLSFLLTSDSNAGNRQVALKLLNPFGVTVAAMPVASTQAASLAYEYCFMAQLSNASAVQNLTVISPLFGWILPSSYQLQVSFTGGHAGDQITKIVYYRDRFSTDPEDYTVGGVATTDVEQALRRGGAIIGA